MNNALYDVYRKEVFLLAKTLVIKHHDTALAMNHVLRQTGYDVIESDQTTWRYYRHLAGEYHPADTPMYITDLDDVNMPEVLLTKTLLADHRITRESYQYGTRFYQELIQRYPAQEMLILGMLNPVHINDAINAQTGAILYYDPALVEEWEISLVSELEHFIVTYFTQRYVKDYTLFNNLYAGSAFCTLCAFLPAIIMEIRARNIKTDHVHSYHVMQYLESHLRLGKYVPYMNRRTMMFLYRNIRWIMRNAGSQKVFYTLVERVLTEQNIPLTTHDLIKTISSADAIVNRDTYPDDPYPEVAILPRDINLTTLSDVAAFTDVEELVRRQADLLGYTENEVKEHTHETIWKMKPSNENELDTKVLASTMTDDTDSVHFPLGEVLINHWIYYASTDRYPANISFVNPATNEQIIISTKDALLLYVYLIYMVYNDMTPPTELVKQAAVSVLKINPPTLNDINKIIDVSATDPEKLAAIRNTQISLPPLTSSDVFYNHCQEIQQFMMHQRYVYSSTMYMDEYAYLMNAAKLHYASYEVDPGGVDGTTVLYSDWLSQKNIVLTGLSPLDVRTLANTIAGLATGAGESSSRTLREMHRAMISMMRDLSSYSIQYLRSITNVNEFPLDWNFSRYSRSVMNEDQYLWAGIPSYQVLTMDCTTTLYMQYPIDVIVEQDFKTRERVHVEYGDNTTIELNEESANQYFINIPSFEIIRDDFLIDLENTPVTSADEYHNP